MNNIQKIFVMVGVGSITMFFASDMARVDDEWPVIMLGLASISIAGFFLYKDK